MKRFLFVKLSCLTLLMVFGTNIMSAKTDIYNSKKTKYNIPLIYVYNTEVPVKVVVDDLISPIYNTETDKESEYLQPKQCYATSAPSVGNHTIKFYTEQNVLYKQVSIYWEAKKQYHYNISTGSFCTWNTMIEWVTQLFNAGGRYTTMYNAPYGWYQSALKWDEESVKGPTIAQTSVTTKEVIQTKREDAQPELETATLYIRRPFQMAWRAKHHLTINGEEIGTIDSKKCYVITVPTGSCKLTLNVNDNMVKVNQDFYLRKNEKVYVRLNEGGGWNNLITIETESKASEYAPDRTFVLNSIKENQIKNAQSKPQTKNEQNHQIKLLEVDNVVELDNRLNDTYVLIISNEQYEYLDKVNYAAHDGEIFKEYCTKTLGVPKKQIFYYINATFGKITDGVEKLKYCLNNFEGSKAIVYYCGHGIPDEKTGQAYLIPVDGKGTNMTTCYSLKNLYKTLAATKAESITYFMDACFTGANKEGSMLVAARGVAREPVKETLAGKTIVFSASSGDETAMTLEEQGHGLFTYYLLKKLQETEGNVTYGELADYINKNVKKDAFLINEKPQTPVVATSPAVQNTWKTMKLK